jgi:hypothetical protein
VANDAGFDWLNLVGKQVYLHRGDKLMTVQSVDGSGEDKEMEITFTGTINFNVPQGAVVQERITSGYKFAFLNQASDAWSNIREVGFETLDGRVVPIASATYSESEVQDDNGRGAIGQGYKTGTDGRRIDVVIDDAVQPPALIPRINLPPVTWT